MRRQRTRACEHLRRRCCRPASHVRYDSGDAPSVTANAACDWPNEIRHSRSVQGSTTSHHPSAAGRCEARGWRSAYFSQPIVEGDRSLFSPVPSPLVPRQRAQSANSLGNGAPGRIRTCDPRLRRPRIASCLLRPVPPSGQHPYGPRDEEMTPRSVRSLSRPAVTAESHARFADLGRFFAPRGVRPGLIRGRPLRPPARRPRDTRPAARPPGASRLR